MSSLHVEPRVVVEMMCPYEPGTPADEVRRRLGLGSLVHLASNENPLGPSPRAVEILNRTDLALHNYPDNEGHDLRVVLAEHLGVSPTGIILGAGSSDLMPLIADAFLDAGDEGIVPDLCFPVYEQVIRLAGARAVVVPLDAHFDHDLERMLAAVTPATKVLFLASPNNPTGRAVAQGDLEQFVARLPEHTLCVLDLAYHEYARVPSLPAGLLLAHPNLLCLYTFSKVYGLAGLRVGYAVGAPDVIDALHRVQTPFHTSSAGQLAARIALADRAHVEGSVRANNAGRAALERGLLALGVRSEPSEANFVMAHVGVPSEVAFEGLLRRGLIVRPLRHRRTDRCLRITVGTPLQVDAVIGALGEVLGELRA